MKKGEISTKPISLNGGETLPLLLWFQMKWNNSKGRLKFRALAVLFQMMWNDSKGRPNIGGLHLNNDPLRRKHKTSPFIKIILKCILRYFINNILWRRGGPMFPPQWVVIETYATNIRSSLAVISLHLKSKQQGLWNSVSPFCYFT